MNRPPIPWRMRKLPRVRGLPVPFFSVIDADGVAHFSTVDWPKMPLPARRAGSPVQFSSWPRMAKSTSACFSSFAVARAIFLARSS